MKQTLVQISNMLEVLSSIQTENFKINYWISRNMRNLEDSYTFMCEQRNKIYQEYLMQDENGNYATPIENGSYKFNMKDESQESNKQFAKKMNELFNLECDVDVYLVDVDTLMEQNISLSPYQITCIQSLLIEK